MTTTPTAAQVELHGTTFPVRSIEALGALAKVYNGLAPIVLPRPVDNGTIKAAVLTVLFKVRADHPIQGPHVWTIAGGSVRPVTTAAQEIKRMNSARLRKF